MTGSGTFLDPYVIYNVNDLQNIALDLTAYYVLNNNIDCTGFPWVEIAEWPDVFSGNLDGRNFHIINMTPTAFFIDQVVAGTVRNLVFDNFVVTNLAVGAWAAVFGSVETGSIIDNVHASGVITLGESAEAGLLIMQIYAGAVITNCSSSGTINVKTFLNGRYSTGTSQNLTDQGETEVIPGSAITISSQIRFHNWMPILTGFNHGEQIGFSIEDNTKDKEIEIETIVLEYTPRERIMSALVGG